MAEWIMFAGELLFVFTARLADVALSTVRFMMMVRGKRTLAAAIGLVEIAIWVLALGRVLQALDDPVKVLFYCLGFAAGIYVGQWLEEKLAVGILAVQVIPRQSEKVDGMVEGLRAKGFGVTVLTGEGRDGPRRVLMVVARRKAMGTVLGLVRSSDPDAFVTVLDARSTIGGTLMFRK